MTTIAITDRHDVEIAGRSTHRRFHALSVRIHRTGARAERVGVERLAEGGLALLVVRIGSTTVADADGVRGVRAGEMLVADPSRHLAVRLDPDAEVAVLLVPAALVRAAGASARASSGEVVPASDGRAGLVDAMVDGLLSLPTAASESRAARLAQHVVGLLAWSIEPRGAAPHARGALARAAKDEIEARLDEVGLSPEAVARALNVSTRTLHRSLEAEGTSAGGWMRARRLERCRAELADAAFGEVAVSAIGARWGLCDAAHFSRSFKEAFGLSPRAYRQRHLAHECQLACVEP